MKRKLFSILFVLALSFSLAAAVPAETATVNPGESIQDAIDLASTGETINVAAGTYTEYLHITTDGLTIEGAGIDQSIIDLDGLIPYWHYRGQHGGSPSKSFASRAGVLISGYGSPDQIIEDVTFKGFTVKNAGLNPPIIATGTHTGSSNAAVLTDSTKSWVINALVDQWVHNVSDKLIKIDISGNNPIRSYGLITANTATTVTATLHGGLDNDWDVGDTYEILPYEEFVDVAEDGQDDVRGIGIGNGKDITIQYCKVINSGYGGITTGYARSVTTHKYSEDITVDNCIVTDHPAAGIGIGSNVGQFTVTNNIVENNGSPHPTDPSREFRGYGIQVKSSKTYAASGLIANNKVKNNGYQGIILAKYIDNVTVENNEVKGHKSDQDGAGIFFYGDKSNPANCKNIIIRNNKLEKNIRGIVAYYASYITIEGNKIKTDSGSFPQGQGAIKIDGGNNITVLNNTISCDGVGIKVQSTWNNVESCDNTFTGNTINKAKFAGIYIRGDAHDNEFTYNTIKATKILTLGTQTQGDGVFIHHDDDSGATNPTGNVFHQNNIYDNDGDGMENQTTTEVNAECNWWGHYKGPDFGDAVNGNVDSVGWLALPAGSEFRIENAKIDFKKKADDDKVHVKGQLKAVCWESVPTSGNIEVRIGTLTPWTVSIAAIEEKGKEGEEWEYKRPKGDPGEVKNMTIDWKKGSFDIHIDKADLSGLTDPGDVNIGVMIGGSDFGDETIVMTAKDGKWEYKAEKVKSLEASKAEESIAQSKFSLSQNYPNPFNPETTIEYDIPEDCQVILKIYNLAGQLVKTLIDEFQSSGHYIITWHGETDGGQEIASGVYFYQIRAGDSVSIKKMVVLK